MEKVKIKEELMEILEMLKQNNLIPRNLNIENAIPITDITQYNKRNNINLSNLLLKKRCLDEDEKII